MARQQDDKKIDKPDFKRGDRVAYNPGNYSDSLYIVDIASYMAGDRWVILAHKEGYARLKCEHDCSKLHLVGERKEPKPPSETYKDLKEGIKKIKMKLTKPAIITLVVLFVVLILGTTVVGNYNSLVSSRADVDNSWAKVETQYQRRLDLIGNLVGSVKGAQGQEQTVFGKIADARKQYQNAQTTNDKASAASALETNIALVPKLQEAYPELKSNVQVTKLMDQLTGTENTIASARDNYNDTVKNYNVNIKSFPKSVYAGIFNYDQAKLFQADAQAKTAPKVDFGANN